MFSNLLRRRHLPVLSGPARLEFACRQVTITSFHTAGIRGLHQESKNVALRREQLDNLVTRMKAEFHNPTPKAFKAVFLFTVTWALLGSIQTFNVWVERGKYAQLSEEPTGFTGQHLNELSSMPRIFSAMFFDRYFAPVELLDLGPDDERMQRVEKVLTKLARAAGLEQKKWQISICNDEENVGATVNRQHQVTVSTALLATMESDSQLAFVLGHELAHCIAEHDRQAVHDYHARAKLRFLLPIAVMAAMSQIKRVKREKNILEYALALWYVPLWMHGWVINSKIAIDWQKEADELGLLLMTEAGFDATEAWKAAARLPEDRCRLHAEDRQGLLVHYLYKLSLKSVRRAQSVLKMTPGVRDRVYGKIDNSPIPGGIFFVDVNTDRKKNPYPRPTTGPEGARWKRADAGWENFKQHREYIRWLASLPSSQRKVIERMSDSCFVGFGQKQVDLERLAQWKRFTRGWNPAATAGSEVVDESTA